MGYCFSVKDIFTVQTEAVILPMLPNLMPYRGLSLEVFDRGGKDLVKERPANVFKIYAQYIRQSTICYHYIHIYTYIHKYNIIIIITGPTAHLRPHRVAGPFAYCGILRPHTNNLASPSRRLAEGFFVYCPNDGHLLKSLFFLRKPAIFDPM